MKFMLLTLITQLTTSDCKYCAYRARYENHSTDTIIIISNNDFINHSIYLYDHFNLDAVSYNSKSPIVSIEDFIFCNSISDIERWLD